MPSADSRVAEVRAQLATVSDPELDESVIDLGFVSKVAVSDAGDVSVGFRLPTFWCSANFAFLMAADMRESIVQLPWVRRIYIDLVDHFCSDQISWAASRGVPFEGSFGEDAGGDLSEVRLTFRRKAFQKRQEMLLRHLLAMVYPPGIVSLRVQDLVSLPLDESGTLLRARYLDVRRQLGFPTEENVLAIHDVDGCAVQHADLTRYMLALRRVGLNADFNSELCRGLLPDRILTDPHGLVRGDAPVDYAIPLAILRVVTAVPP